MNKVIVFIFGLKAVGKTFFSNYVKEVYNIPYIQLRKLFNMKAGGFLEAKKLYQNFSKTNNQYAWLINLKEEIKNVLDVSRIVVIEGVQTQEEIQWFKDQFFIGCIQIYIENPCLEERILRYQLRKNITNEDAKEKIYANDKLRSLIGVENNKDYADYVIENTESKDTFEKSIDNVFQNILENRNKNIELIGCILDKTNLILELNFPIRYVWFENANKHICEIYSLRSCSENRFVFDINYLKNRTYIEPLILSMSDNSNKILYSCDLDFSTINNEVNENASITLSWESNKLYLQYTFEKKDISYTYIYSNEKTKNYHSKPAAVLSQSKPQNIAVIGTCFSRSIFRSDEYFNPEYKEYFNVPLTFFHSSIVSLMSDPLDDISYLSTTDLTKKDVYRYIIFEFRKNIVPLLVKNKIRWILIDNYSEAALDIVEMNEGSYLTYNKYFSESIYKRNFANHNVVSSGTEKHLQLYKESLMKFKNDLLNTNLENNIVLLSARLSLNKKIFDYPYKMEWTDKKNWILQTNQKWELYDNIFIEIFPTAYVIDKQNTEWISEINPPITGGESPSHYQSMYYKEIFEELKGVVYGL